MAKLLENIFRSVNIALVNELAVLCDRMGIDIWEVVDAAVDQAVRLHALRPGPGMGGHCLPVDPFYLAWRAREFDFSTEFIELAGKINQSMPYFCVEQDRARAERAGQGRPRLADPAARRRLQARRRRPARVARAEDHASCSASAAPSSPTTTRTCPTLPERGLESMPLEPALEGADLVVIVTAHPERRLRRVVVDGAAGARLPRRDARHRVARPSCGCDAPRRVAVGVVGLGYWGPNLARNFAALAGCELRWCCDRSRGARARRSAPRFPARASRRRSTSCWPTPSSTRS